MPGPLVCFWTWNLRYTENQLVKNMKPCSTCVPDSPLFPGERRKTQCSTSDECLHLTELVAEWPTGTTVAFLECTCPSSWGGHIVALVLESKAGGQTWDLWACASVPPGSKWNHNQRPWNSTAECYCCFSFFLRSRHSTTSCGPIIPYIHFCTKFQCFKGQNPIARKYGLFIFVEVFWGQGRAIE